MMYDKELASFHRDMQAERSCLKEISTQGKKKTLRQKIFELRTVILWNSLPEEVVNATDTNMYKDGVNKPWEIKICCITTGAFY